MRDKEPFKSLLKAIDILNLLLRKRIMLSPYEISGSLGTPRSTTYKYLAILREHGFVDYDKESGRYKLGLRLFEFGSFVKSQIEIDKIAIPYEGTSKAGSGKHWE
jgi:DNA-binding IclR family transcriptional regulator